MHNLNDIDIGFGTMSFSCSILKTISIFVIYIYIYIDIYIYIYTHENGHTHVWENDFKILGNNYQLNIKRKQSESLYIRQLKPTLNANEKSVPLHNFNWFFDSNYP